MTTEEIVANIIAVIMFGTMGVMALIQIIVALPCILELFGFEIKRKDD